MILEAVITDLEPALEIGELLSAQHGKKDSVNQLGLAFAGLNKCAKKDNKDTTKLLMLGAHPLRYCTLREKPLTLSIGYR